jgi:hypothetical protein
MERRLLLLRLFSGRIVRMLKEAGKRRLKVKEEIEA